MSETHSTEHTFESRATLLIVLHDDAYDKTTVILAMKRGGLEHRAKTMDEGHNADA